MGIQGDGVTLVQIENNTIKYLMEFNSVTTSGKRQALVSQILDRAYFSGPDDGCYEKSEYYLVKVWRQGMAVNCLRIRHIDLKKKCTIQIINLMLMDFLNHIIWLDLNTL